MSAKCRDALNNILYTLFKESQQNHEIKKFREVIFQKLKALLLNALAHEKYQVGEISLYGSSVNGFETKSSDVDVSINFEDNLNNLNNEDKLDAEV